MAFAIANFEEQVWNGTFIPKWQRIVQRIINRPKIKVARKKKAATEESGEAAAAAASSSPSAPAPRESTSSDGAARVLSNLASGSSSSPNMSASASAVANSPWNTSTKGSFTKSGQALLTRWFIDHITDPYPKDHEKHELARAARLSYDQISAWMINARMRKWVGWIQALQAGEMTQSASVAAAAAVGPKGQATEGAEYKLKRIEAMKSAPKSKKAAATKKDSQEAVSAEPASKAATATKSKSAKARKTKSKTSDELESESEGASDFSDEAELEEAVELKAESATGAAAASSRRSTRARKASARKQAELESDSDDVAEEEDEAMLVKQEEEMPEQDDDDDETLNDVSPAANASSAAAVKAEDVPAGLAPAAQLHMTHSPTLTGSNPALLGQYLDPLSQYVFSGHTLAPFNVLSLTMGQHAQLTLPTVGGGLSDSALAMSMSGSMPAIYSQPTAEVGEGATVGAGMVGSASGAAASSVAASSPVPTAAAAATAPLRSPAGDAMLLSVDPFTTSIAHLQYQQSQMRSSGLNMSGTMMQQPFGIPGQMLPPMPMQHSASPHALSFQQSAGGGMMFNHASQPMGMGSIPMGAASLQRLSPMQPSQLQQALHHAQHSHPNPSATLLQGRVPAPFVSGLPLAFTGAPASRDASPAQMSLPDLEPLSEVQMMAAPTRSSHTPAPPPSASSSRSSSTAAPSFGAFRLG